MKYKLNVRNIIKKITTLNQKIDENFFNDYHQWILWIPIIFSTGILLYFSIPHYKPLLFTEIVILQIFLLFIFRKKKEYLITLFVILIGFLGYFRTAQYTESLKSPTIKYRLGNGRIYGTIENIGYYERNGKDRKRITVRVDKIEKIGKIEKVDRVRNNMTSHFGIDGVMINPPAKVRININNKKYKPKFGDKVVVKANLVPNPKQLFVSSYNFKRENYYRQIGGIGVNGYVEKHSIEQQTIINRLHNFREKLSGKIISAVDSPSSPVIASFITGMTDKIADEDISNMRYAGLAHLIAISGIHMAIIMGLFFTSIRRILVSSEYLTLNYNIKKIAAIATLIIGFLYLCVTGFPVSATRAFVMSALYFTGIIIDRQPNTMRFLALAAMFILIDRPNMILSPSFQMSFMAVVGLASGFNFLKNQNIKLFTSNKYFKPLYYIKATLFSSLIAELCITPIAIYHFNNYTPYNLITNFVAIPITSFFTIPLSAISLILMPFHLEKIALIPACLSMDIVLEISRYVSNLKYGYFIFPSPSKISIVFIIFGLLWFFLWQERWRYFGILIFIMGIIFSIFKTVPDVIIDKDDKIVAIVKDSEIYFSSDKNTYKVEIIKTKMGKKSHKLLPIDENFEEIFRNKEIIENFVKIEKEHGVFKYDYIIQVVPVK